MTRAVGERRAVEGETGFERVMWVSGDEGCGGRATRPFLRFLPGAEGRPAPQSGRSTAEDGGPALFCFAMQSRRMPAAEKRGGPPLRLAFASGLLATLKRPFTRPLTVLELRPAFREDGFSWSGPALSAPSRRQGRSMLLVVTPEMSNT